MRGARLAACASLIAELVACGGDGKEQPGHQGASSSGTGGAAETGCAAGEVEQPDGSCRPAGVRTCADGFVADGPSCNAVLPMAACPKGQMAVPGDADCREIMPCGAAPFGGIPVEADTMYVDSTYAGTDSDGSVARPFKAIGDAMSAARAGAIVAVAEGSYPEDVEITGSKRLWGRCPSMVELVATGGQPGGILVRTGNDGAEVHGIAIRGASFGIVASGSSDILVERVWIHDTAQKGVSFEDTLGVTTATLRGSLVETTHDIGVGVLGATATIETTVIRGVKPVAANGGRGLEVNPGQNSGAPATVAMKGSVIEQSHSNGAFVRGSQLVVEASVVRDTQFEASSQSFGHALTAQAHETSGERGRIEVHGSILERCYDTGILAAISDVVVEDTVIRDVRAAPANKEGAAGVMAQNAEGSATARGTAKVTASLVEAVEGVGVLAIGSDASVEESVVRKNVARPSDGRWGKGIHYQTDFGAPGTGSTGTVRSSVIDDNMDCGIMVVDSTVTIDATRVRGTQTETDGRYGDGIVGLGIFFGADVTISGAQIDHNVRAGVVPFGAHVTVAASHLECNAIQLDEEPGPFDPVLEDFGNNHCGCDGVEETCKVLSAHLEPPQE